MRRPPRQLWRSATSPPIDTSKLRNKKFPSIRHRRPKASSNGQGKPPKTYSGLTRTRIELSIRSCKSVSFELRGATIVVTRCGGLNCDVPVSTLMRGREKRLKMIPFLTSFIDCSIAVHTRCVHQVHLPCSQQTNGHRDETAGVAINGSGTISFHMIFLSYAK